MKADLLKVRPRMWGLFGKYVISFVGLVVFVLAVNGALEISITYRDATNTGVAQQTQRAEQIGVSRRCMHAAYISEMEVHDPDQEDRIIHRGSDTASVAEVPAPVGSGERVSIAGRRWLARAPRSREILSLNAQFTSSTRRRSLVAAPAVRWSVWRTVNGSAASSSSTQAPSTIQRRRSRKAESRSIAACTRPSCLASQPNAPGMVRRRL